MDLYSVLDLMPAATPADIERAYLRLARRYHPGINPGDRLAADRFRQVQADDSAPRAGARHGPTEDGTQ